jgi:hypothetical protein
MDLAIDSVVLGIVSWPRRDEGDRVLVAAPLHAVSQDHANFDALLIVWISTSSACG